MKVLNFGSLNIDHVFSVDHMVQAGETINASSKDVYAGGKGLNQSIALARAGVPVYHAGVVGEDGTLLLRRLVECGVDISLLCTVEGPSSHTFIQVDRQGQNCIVVYTGSNIQVTEAYVDQVLKSFGAGDFIVLQNEINAIDSIMEKASAKGMRIVFNPSPLDDRIIHYPLEKVDFFLMNELEGHAFTGYDEPEKIIKAMHTSYPSATIVLTLGADGVLCCHRNKFFRQAACPAPVVDTTAAGDTFTGYFIACLLKNRPIQEILEKACRASAITVGRKGASDAIPTAEEVEHRR